MTGIFYNHFLQLEYLQYIHSVKHISGEILPVQQSLSDGFLLKGILFHFVFHI